MQPRFLAPQYDLPRIESSPWHALQTYPATVPSHSNPTYLAGASLSASIAASALWTPLSHVHVFKPLFNAIGVNSSYISPKFYIMYTITRSTSWHQGFGPNIISGIGLGAALTAHRTMADANRPMRAFGSGALIGVGYTVLAHPYDVVKQSSMTHNTSPWQLLRVIVSREKSLGPFLRQLYVSFPMSCGARVLYYSTLFGGNDMGKYWDVDYLRPGHYVAWAYFSAFVALWLSYPIGNVQRMLMEANGLPASRVARRHVLRYESFTELIMELRRTRGMSTVWTGFAMSRPFVGAWRGAIAMCLQDYLLRKVPI